VSAVSVRGARLAHAPTAAAGASIRARAAGSICARRSTRTRAGAGERALVPTGRPRDSRRMGGSGAAAQRASRCSTDRAPQCARHDRQRLPRRGDGDPRESRERAVHPSSRRSHRAARRRAVAAVDWVESVDLAASDARAGGFGSTGRS
jgi:hypothetical protein